MPAKTRSLACLALLWIGCRAAPANEAEPIKTSGAFEALSFWGTSRAYPERDIPVDAYSRAYEHSRDTLRGPVRDVHGPLGEDGAPPPLSKWRPLGPTNGGGRTLAIAFDPVDASTVYAGAASGGLWRSTTGGVGARAWERIDTGFPVLGVSTIAFEPGSSSVIYIGTGEVYNHQNAGNLEANRATRGSYGIGILKSLDGGASWTKSLDWSYNQRHGVWMIRVDPTDTSVVWAATTDGVYRSADAGATWTRKLSVVMATDVIVHPTDPNIVLAACGNLSSAGHGIYRSTDDGDSWTQIVGGGVPASWGGKAQFGVTPADPNVVYASIGNGFSSAGAFTWLLRSTNFGQSFTLQTTTDYSLWQGWFAHDVAVSPTDPTHVVCVGIDVWRSTSSGVSLQQTSDWGDYFTGVIPPGGPEGPASYSHADHHDVAFHPTVPDLVYLANDGGVFRSLDGGLTFEGVNGGYQSQQFYNGSTSHPTDPGLAMGGLQDNASAIYHGSPGAWSRWVLGGDGGWCAIDPTDPDTVYATAQYLFVGRSDDGGVSFSDVSPPDQGGPVAFIAPLLLAPSDPSVLYGGSDHLFRSTNGGSSWSIRNGGSPVDGNPILAMAVAQEDEDVLYLATAPFSGSGSVHRTLDGGGTLTDVTGTLPDRYPGDLTVDPSDEATVYVTFSGFGTSHVFRSTDYGTPGSTSIAGGCRTSRRRPSSWIPTCRTTSTWGTTSASTSRTTAAGSGSSSTAASRRPSWSRTSPSRPRTGCCGPSPTAAGSSSTASCPTWAGR